jgi:hypothetical protein
MILHGFGEWDGIEAGRQVSAFGDSVRVSEDDLLAALVHVDALPVQYPEATIVVGPDGPITWHRYEQLAWALGESVRQILKRQRALRRSARLWPRVEAIATATRYGKGRESFVMLLGTYGGPERAPSLVSLLDDPEVAGHAVYALRRLGVPDGLARVEPLLRHRRAWIRREARKYLDKVGGR